MYKDNLKNRLKIKYKIFKSHSQLTKNSSIYFHSSITFDRNCFFTARGGQIEVDSDCSFNIQVVLNADIGGKIKISENCIIGPRVILRTANHKFSEIEKIKRLQGHEVGDIFIGKNVWIGANVVILPGVSIGENSVIGAGAVVTESIPKSSLAVGVPAKVKKHL
jgi:acetyltransferase-like isoleucine patch superfamily enzyme